MKRALLISMSLSLVATTTLVWARASQADNEYQAVRETVEHYLYGLKHNDVEKLKLAFYPEAKLFFIRKDNQLGQLTQEQWYKGFAASAGQEEKGDLRITAVDITDNAASVKVEEFYDTAKYTDYLSLLKINGEWKIVNKIYTVEKTTK
jgi:hypothetical protein